MTRSRNQIDGDQARADTSADGLGRVQELLENGYAIEDVDSTDDAIHVSLSAGGGTLVTVALDARDARAILRGEAAWLEDIDSDYVVR